jgi:hypothetical protein
MPVISTAGACGRRTAVQGWPKAKVGDLIKNKLKKKG